MMMPMLILPRRARVWVKGAGRDERARAGETQRAERLKAGETRRAERLRAGETAKAAKRKVLQEQGAVDRAFGTSLTRLEERCKAEPAGKTCGGLEALRRQKRRGRIGSVLVGLGQRGG